MTASPLIIPVARFFNISDGAGLAGGQVYTYAAGTNTLKASYTAFNGLTPNTNPVILDSSGSAGIWLNGNYKINVLDSNGVQQPNYPVDNVASISSGAGASNFVVTTGSANSYIAAPAPALITYDTGTTYNIQINATNTGPSTINFSGIGSQNIVRNGAIPLIGGELQSGSIYEIIYDGTNFQLQNPTPPIDITYGFQAVAPWGRLTLNGNTIAKTSGGTFNGNQYARLYTYLWTNCSSPSSNAVAPVTGGLGVSAAADFAANKSITLPTGADLSPYGIGSLITQAGATAGAAAVTSAGSVSVSMNAITLSISQIPAPSISSVVSSASAGTTNNLGGGTGMVGTDTTSISTNFGGGSFTPTVASSSYTGSSTSVVHPVMGIYWYINY